MNSLTSLLPQEDTVQTRSRAGTFPRPVLISVGGRIVRATAEAVRAGRRGHQTLVRLHGRLVWVATYRVADLDAWDGG